MAEQYISIARRMADKIRGRRNKVGALLPTRVELAAEYGVARATIDRAINLLAARGMLESRKRAGTFVKSTVAVHKIGFVCSYADYGRHPINAVHEFRHVDRDRAVGRAALPHLRQYDGVIWMTPERDVLPVICDLEKHLPVIVINRELPGHNFVSIDHYGAVRDITTRRLARHAGAIPVFVQGMTPRTMVAEARKNGFVDACRAHDHFYEDLTFADEFSGNVKLLTRKLAGCKGRTLVMVSDSISHTGAVMAWVRDTRRRFGADTFYCDFDNDAPRNRWGVVVTSFLQDWRRMVNVAAAEIVRLVDGKIKKFEMLIPPELVQGET